MSQSQTMRALPDGFLDNVWNRLSLNPDGTSLDDDSSRKELLAAIDDVCSMFNEYDAERFPLEVEGELVEDADEQ